MIFHENRLLADDSHEISYLICYFIKQQNLKFVIYIKLQVVHYGLKTDRLQSSVLDMFKGVIFILFQIKKTQPNIFQFT